MNPSTLKLLLLWCLVTTVRKTANASASRELIIKSTLLEVGTELCPYLCGHPSFFFFFVFMCMSVLPVCMVVQHVSVWWS